MTRSHIGSRSLTPWVARLGCLLGILALAFAIGCGASGSSGSSGSPARFAGTYMGTFAGDDTGTFSATVDELGAVPGTGTSTADGAVTITGTVNGTGNLSGTTSNGATWTGVFSESGLDGTWTDGADDRDVHRDEGVAPS